MTDPAQQTERARQTETARKRWLDPAWHAEISAWTGARLAERSIRMTGPMTQPHIRPWSTAISIPTDIGPVWFKAAGPGNAYEAVLLDALARWQTARILEPLAVELERGWLLLPDGGARLREGLDGGPGVDAWLRVLPEYATLQRDVAPRADELVAVGIPDLRPQNLASQLASLLEDPTVVMPPEDRSRLRAALADVSAWSAELAALGIASTIQHDDLHDGNVLVGPDGGRFFDWGDASVAHPFGTLLVTFRSIASRGLGDADNQARELARLQDAYLEPWTASHTRADLAAAVPLATRLAIIGRAMSWHRALAGIPPQDHGEWAGNVGAWLMDLFEENLV